MTVPVSTMGETGSTGRLGPSTDAGQQIAAETVSRGSHLFIDFNGTGEEGCCDGCYRYRNAHKGQDRGAHLIRRPPGVDANLALALKTTDPSLMCFNGAYSD